MGFNLVRALHECYGQFFCIQFSIKHTKYMGGGSRRLLCHNLHLFLIKLGKKRTDFVGLKFTGGPSSSKLPGEPPPTPFPMKKGLAERKN